jgi:hypothetical protein
LKGGDFTAAPEDILEFLPIYNGGDRDLLLSLLELLQKTLIIKSSEERQGSLKMKFIPSAQSAPFIFVPNVSAILIS